MVYNTDAEFHLNKRREVSEAKRAKKKGGMRAAAVAAAAAIASSGFSGLPSDDTPLSALDDDDDDDDDEDERPLASRRSKPPSVVPTRIYSPPLSSPPSLKEEPRELTPAYPIASEPPPTPTIPPQAVNGTPVITSASQMSPSMASASPSAPRKPRAPAVPHVLCVSKIPIRCQKKLQGKLKSLNFFSLQPPGVPDWLRDALELTKAEYLSDDFGGFPRPSSQATDPKQIEWRVKCYDCPGKVRVLGLSRVHRSC